MADSSGSAAISGRGRRVFVVQAVIRPSATLLVCLLAYFLLPWPRLGGDSVAMSLVGGGLFLAVATAWNLRRIVRSQSPALRAVEALAVVVPVYVLGFAVTYYLAADGWPGAFTEPLTRMGALYFSLTVLATVGFGDIAAVTDGARALVSVQIAGNLLLLGLGLRVLTRTVGLARRRRDRS
ncbi:two pore domain potassium channel family protein [Rhodococcus triatomae]|uniref:Ion channel n=1 Tax=Rhodococcus triatomae TaxID=300028 RepID=A0A1G8R4V9_9NOCA|nr:potassium channel family protein [Rhodococcus triatomae]QNG19572.1 two pore domain potassium channel family protein [Rhodococcus triatomae]QNG24513.1 two pore domain potassium channel family protein [Rhodococcus triatomae]SDJ11999.1 Ion channel [Rhodococcus triatomae]